MQLTEKENEIMALAAEGFGRNQIAQKLFLSPHTIKNHLHRIYAKNNVHSLLEAVVLYLKPNTD